MARVSATEQQPHQGDRAVRKGRPPQALAGEVEGRILDAARQVFFERGLGRATIDEIARRASAGKPSIYARFASKEALFAAVVMRTVGANIARLGSHVPAGATAEARLSDVGVTVLHWILISDGIGLLRLAIAEAPRFPELASSVYARARARGAEAVAGLLREAAKSDDLGKLPAFAPERLSATAMLFVDLILLPLLMRGLLGAKLEALHAEIAPHVARSVKLFLDGCRHPSGS
jgi:AcrR family transcriptional regulator